MYFLGIDIAKNNHVASLIDSDGRPSIKTIKFTNNNEGYEKLISQISTIVSDKHEIEIAMEATGHYWLALFSKLVDDGYSVSVYNPFQIKAFRGAYHNRKQKTDVIDAIIIANYIRTFGGKNTTLPNDELLNLKQLTRYRSDLVKSISSTKNQVIAILDKVFPEYSSLFSDAFGKTSKAILLEAATPEELVKISTTKLKNIVEKTSRGRFSKDFVINLKSKAEDSFGVKFMNKACSFEIKQLINSIIFIEEQLAQLDKEIKEIYKELDEFLTTIPGVGDILAPAILAEIGDISNFSSPRKLVAFAGIDPSSNQSGDSRSVNEKTSKRGSPYLRNAIYSAAFVAISNDEHMKDYYYRKKAEGKHHYVALAGVQRKMLQIIWALLTEKRAYAPYTSTLI
jgi:transposase